jgi:uncharacterized membrane protein
VWVFIALLLTTGYAGLYLRFGGFAGSVLYLKLIHGIGLLMVLAFSYLYFGLYRRPTGALRDGDAPAAVATIARMRLVMLTNLSLGVLIIPIGISGPYV